MKSSKPLSKFSKTKKLQIKLTFVIIINNTFNNVRFQTYSLKINIWSKIKKNKKNKKKNATRNDNKKKINMFTKNSSKIIKNPKTFIIKINKNHEHKNEYKNKYNYIIVNNIIQPIKIIIIKYKKIQILCTIF